MVSDGSCFEKDSTKSEPQAAETSSSDCMETQEEPDKVEKKEREKLQLLDAVRSYVLGNREAKDKVVVLADKTKTPEVLLGQIEGKERELQKEKKRAAEIELNLDTVSKENERIQSKLEEEIANRKSQEDKIYSQELEISLAWQKFQAKLEEEMVVQKTLEHNVKQLNCEKSEIQALFNRQREELIDQQKVNAALDEEIEIQKKYLEERGDFGVARDAGFDLEAYIAEKASLLSKLKEEIANGKSQEDKIYSLELEISLAWQKFQAKLEEEMAAQKMLEHKLRLLKSEKNEIQILFDKQTEELKEQKKVSAALNERNENQKKIALRSQTELEQQLQSLQREKLEIQGLLKAKTAKLSDRIDDSQTFRPVEIEEALESRSEENQKLAVNTLELKDALNDLRQ